MSKHILLASMMLLSFGCIGRGPIDDPDCRCAGEVPSGHLEAACGDSVCVGGVGYLCTGLNTAVEDPGACMMPPDPGEDHALTVHALAYMRDLIPDAAAGNVHLRVELELTNSTSDALLLGFGAYGVETASGLQFVGSVATHDELVDNPCPVEASLAAGRSYRCNVVFELPRGEAPSFLFHTEMREDRTPIVLDWREELNRRCAASLPSCYGCLREAASSACAMDVEAMPTHCQSALIGFEYPALCGAELQAEDECEAPITGLRSCVDSACVAECD